jgi:two-component system, NtrC family, nitrogen regulation sensor histidine kinase NtrY
LIRIKNTNNFFGRNGYLLVASAWLFTLSFIIDNYWSGSSTSKAVRKEVQKDILKKQRKIQDILDDTVLLNNIVNRTYTEKQLDDLVAKDYFLFIYKVTPFESPFPVFWNTQIIEPDSTTLDVPDGTRFQKLNNGWYVISKKSYENKNGLLYEIVSLIPVKWSYYVENKYLHNSFVAIDNIENEYDISLKPTGDAIKDNRGENLFYLKQINYSIASNDNVFSLCLRILAAVLVLFFIHKLANLSYLIPQFMLLILCSLLLVTCLLILSYLSGSYFLSGFISGFTMLILISKRILKNMLLWELFQY